MLQKLACVVLVSISTYAHAEGPTKNNFHDDHAKGSATVSIRISRIVNFENGMSLMLQYPVLENESCLHLENAASFPTDKLNKIITNGENGLPLTVKVSDGHIVDVL